jgi:dienelactone hydrolase
VPVRCSRRFALRTGAAAVLAGVALSAAQTSSSAPDAAFVQFFDARSADEQAAAIDRIVSTGIGVDEAADRLRKGRTYARDAARGAVERSYRSAAGEYFYTLDVPHTYDPAHRYQVRIQLHGGVGRIDSNVPPRAGAASAGRLAGAEQIYVLPYAWKDAPWWSRRQLANLRAILDAVKRTYNVDENRVVVSGVSDGGTGAYYVAMRDTTPYASFLPLNGYIRVLDNETAESDGDLYPNNLANKPLFVVNGGRDPMYPTSLVDPVIAHLKSGGVDVDYRPQASAGHDTSWWPAISGAFERFVAGHPRHPLPDTITWQSGPADLPARAHWLVIERLADAQGSEPRFTDVNAIPAAAVPDFGIRGSATRVHRVLKGSNAEQLGVRAGDVVVAINNQHVGDGTDVSEVLRSFPPGRPLLLSVVRGGEPVRLTGRYAPGIEAGDGAMFSRSHASGRVDLARTGNRVDVKSSGVAVFTLLLSPDQFDLSRSVAVVVNGRTVIDSMVKKDLRTLLTWAAHDNDRTMLFVAALEVSVPR